VNIFFKPSFHPLPQDNTQRTAQGIVGSEAKVRTPPQIPPNHHKLPPNSPQITTKLPQITIKSPQITTKSPQITTNQFAASREVENKPQMKFLTSLISIINKIHFAR